ncbi:MAG TPA: hypothetical protein VEH29_06000 [Acidimicrobiales bacterium]|nr:hypothetical protein [Acidimicrobiales bacterium]
MSQATKRSQRVGGRSRRSLAAVVVMTAGLLVGALLAITPAGAAPRATQASSKRDVYGFNAPDAAAVTGNDLFVANKMGNSITEVGASDGAFMKVLEGAKYHLDEPSALLVLGKDLFVANAKAGVTEIAVSNGALVRTYRGAKYFSGAIALATNGSGDLYVLNAGGSGSITKVVTTSGKMSAFRFSLDKPEGMAAAGQDLFVTNSADNSVTEIDGATMKVLTTLSSATYQFNEPTGIVASGSYVWVANYAGFSVTQFSAATNQFIQAVRDASNLPDPGPITSGDGYVFAASPPGASPMISQIPLTPSSSVKWMMCNTNGPYDFSNPEALVVAGTHLWVVNEGGPSAPWPASLTEMQTGSGRLIRTVS